MRALVVAIFEDPLRAEEVRLGCRRDSADTVVDCDKVVVAERGADGKVSLRYTHALAADGALIGGVWGGLVGFLFLNPLLGAMVGAGVGAATGSLGDLGIDKGFVLQLAERMKPGSSALFVPTAEEQIEEVKALLRPVGGVILGTRLTVEDERALEKALRACSQPGKKCGQAEYEHDRQRV